jgi:hypothetical protein
MWQVHKERERGWKKEEEGTPIGRRNKGCEGNIEERKKVVDKVRERRITRVT